MFKQQMKGFLFGVILTILLSSMVFAAPVSTTIKVIINNINMQINGKAVKSDIIVYNNIPYAPIKTISETLGKQFTWDAKTYAVTIKDKVVTPPAITPVNNLQVIEFSNYLATSNYGVTTLNGEAKNNDTKAHSFSIKASFYDTSGKLLGTAIGSISNINPGETKTYTTMSSSDLSKATNIKVQVDTMYKTSAALPDYISFANGIKRSEYGITTLDIEASNKDTKPHSFSALVTFYDTNKKIIGTAIGSMNEIAAGETKTLTAMGSGDFSTAASYKIQVDTLYK